MFSVLHLFHFLYYTILHKTAKKCFIICFLIFLLCVLRSCLRQKTLLTVPSLERRSLHGAETKTWISLPVFILFCLSFFTMIRLLSVLSWITCPAALVLCGGKTTKQLWRLWCHELKEKQTWKIQVFNFITLNFNRRSMLIVLIMCHQHLVSHQHRCQRGDDVTMRPCPQAAAPHHLVFLLNIFSFALDVSDMNPLVVSLFLLTYLCVSVTCSCFQQNHKFSAAAVILLLITWRVCTKTENIAFFTKQPLILKVVLFSPEK